MLENSNQYDNQRWLPSLRFFFFLNFINRTRKQFYFRYAVRPIFLAKRYAQIRKLKRKNGHNHLSPQTNFNRQRSIIIWRVCVINPWQSSGRIVISTRVLQNLNQFTLKNHEKLNKIDIYGDKTLEPVIITSIASVRMRHAWVLLFHRHNFLSVNLQVYRATVMRALDKSYTKKACSNRLQATGGIRYTQIHLRVLHTVSYLEKVIHL